MILGKTSKVRIRGIKRKFEGREKGTFGAFFRDPEKERKKDQREKRKEGKKGEETKPKPTFFGERKGDLAFQRVHTFKSSLRAKLGA